MEKINPKELFGKSHEYEGYNLSSKSLQKAKKHKELHQAVYDNLPFLVQWYFDPKQKERFRWVKEFQVTMNNYPELFLIPLQQILTASGKKLKKYNLDKKLEIPAGLHVILSDALDSIFSITEERIAKIKSQNRTDISEAEIASEKAHETEMTELINNIISLLTKKTQKSLKKLGINEDYAEALARAFVPKKYLNVNNVGRYIHMLNTTIYEVVKAGITANDKEEYTMDTGVDITTPEVIQGIYELFLKGVDRKVVDRALTGIMLERRSKAMNDWGKPVLATYNAITGLIIDILEGEKVLNTTGAALKKKEAKKLVISGKELKGIIKAFTKEKKRDHQNNNDSLRRINFRSLDPELKMVKVFEANFHETMVEMDEEAEYQREQRRKQLEQQNAQKQKQQAQQQNDNKKKDRKGKK